MTRSMKIFVLLAMALAIAITAVAQMPQQAPSIPGLFKPVVGSGAQYEITPKKGGKSQWTYAIVGKEQAEGAEGHWLEMRMEGGKQGGFIMKTLVIMREGKADIKRMIMQAEGQPPMEMPMTGMMAGMMKRGQAAAGDTSLGEKVGTESITVPAGTFECEHYQKKGARGPSDIWVAASVSPYGLVKMSSQDMTIELLKQLTSEKSQIKGEPQKLEMPQF